MAGEQSSIDDIDAVIADLEAAVEGAVKLREENEALRSRIVAFAGKVRAVVGHLRGSSAPSSAPAGPPQA